jgi:cation diffusion facilitator CzcD-associated flavoprotein CzcO
MTSSCQTTKVPAADTIDIAKAREKYRQERDKRMNERGQGQYVRPTGGLIDNYVEDPHKDVAPREALSDEIDVIVLGAGWGGVLASYHLTKYGITDFRNIDTAGEFGGVWYWNRYPGIQCDNDAYCYLPLLEETGFMPSQKFSDGWEIQGYTRAIAEKFGFADRALFHTHISGLRWDDELQRWHVHTNRGDHFRARFVVMACGVLNMPKLPGIPGIQDFKGKMFHSARWDYDYTGGRYGEPVLDKLADKRVAIIGTGATSIQAVPYLAKHAKQLYVIQRTPSSIDERPNPKTDPEWAKSLEPGWQHKRMDNFHRAAMVGFNPGESDLICDIWTEISRNLAAEMTEEGWPQLTMEQAIARREMMDFQVMERMRQRVAAIVEDPETAEALKPYYRFMCKRPLSNNDFYPVFNQPNVELIDVSDTKGLEAMTEKGFVANGEEYEIDCMIFASGFEATSDLERRWGIDFVEGRHGESIYDHWREGPKTLHGTMTHGFPNQFFIGYIQGSANSSVTEQFGEQGRHIAHIIAETMKRGAAAVEVTQEAQDAYVDLFNEIEVDSSVFLNECTPSYFNNEGEKKPRWALFRAWGRGWDDFQNMVRTWREKGDLEGLALTMPGDAKVEAAE